MKIADIMFLVKSIKFPSDHFMFCHPIRGSSNFKLKHSLCRTEIKERNIYFNRIPRLWNSLHTPDVNLPLSVIKSGIRQFFLNHFMSNFVSNNVCTYHYLCPCLKCSKLPVNMHFGFPLMNIIIIILLVSYVFVGQGGAHPYKLDGLKFT